MDVQAYRVVVRLALDDQITRQMLKVSRDTIELNKKFVTITKNIKALSSAAREASSALRGLNRSLKINSVLPPEVQENMPVLSVQ